MKTLRKSYKIIFTDGSFMRSYASAKELRKHARLHYPEKSIRKIEVT